MELSNDICFQNLKWGEKKKSQLKLNKQSPPLFIELGL